LRVLLTGAAGQLGQALIASCPAQTTLLPLDRRALDLSDANACARAISEFSPDWVINAGAYTAVDRAEAEPELAMAVNAGAPAAFAQVLQESGGRLLQVSTDFVFNGSQGFPYQPQQPVDPLGVYGASKASGEAAVQNCLDPSRFCILRTSWLYGPIGHNFLNTMLRLHAEREQIGVVADQVGCPTATPGLAQACWAVLENGVSGLHHWSDAGAATWYDFALAIGELAAAAGLLNHTATVQPITTADYPTPARRPSYSLLDCNETRAVLGVAVSDWRTHLAAVIHQRASSLVD
jgi:dTDP-4-dehydrorhamnose reductase